MPNGNVTNFLMEYDRNASPSNYYAEGTTYVNSTQTWGSVTKLVTVPQGQSSYSWGCVNPQQYTVMDSSIGGIGIALVGAAGNGGKQEACGSSNLWLIISRDNGLTWGSYTIDRRRSGY